MAPAGPAAAAGGNGAARQGLQERALLQALLAAPAPGPEGCGRDRAQRPTRTNLFADLGLLLRLRRRRLRRLLLLGLGRVLRLDDDAVREEMHALARCWRRGRRFLIADDAAVHATRRRGWLLLMVMVVVVVVVVVGGGGDGVGVVVRTRGIKILRGVMVGGVRVEVIR